MEEKLIELVRKATSNLGDNYYAYLNNNIWHIGYTNDYPLQHGKGSNYTIHNDIVKALFKI